MAYGKIFESLFTGSMVGSGCTVFALWSYVIANSKPPGTVELNPVLLSTVFGCTVQEVEQAIEFLCSPDERSRTKDHDGRRMLREGQFLYSIPTWQKYNSIRNEIERREANRRAQKSWRDRQKDAVSERNSVSAYVSKVSRRKPVVSTSTSAEGEESARGEGFATFWDAYDKKVDRVAAEKAWAKLCLSPALVAQITLAAMTQAKTVEKKFRKDPHRWLNGRCWENETITEDKPKKPTTHIQNMPLGTASCECAGCVEFRRRRVADTNLTETSIRKGAKT